MLQQIIQVQVIGPLFGAGRVNVKVHHSIQMVYQIVQFLACVEDYSDCGHELEL